MAVRVTLIVSVAIAVLPAAAETRSTARTSTTATTLRFVPALKASVRRSHAEIRLLTLRQRRLRLDVVVRDPAAYLKYRYSPVIEVVDNRRVKLDRIFLQVVDASSRRVIFSLLSEAPSLNGTTSWTTSWKIDPTLLDCARTLPLGLEIDIEQQAPPCPA